MMEKMEIINNASVIEKSNHLSMVNLSKGLSLEQMRLLSYCILNLPYGSNISTFSKSDFTEFSEMTHYRNSRLMVDMEELAGISFATCDEEFLNDDNDLGHLEGTLLFDRYGYSDGEITFEFKPVFLKDLQNLSTKYMTLDLSVMFNFKSEYSFLLYEFLKSNFGDKYHHLKKKKISLKDFKIKFDLNGKNSYNRYSNIKARVLKKAIEEINTFTEINITEVKEIRDNKTVTALEFCWTAKELEYGPTKNQVEYFEERYNELLSREEFVTDKNYVLLRQMCEKVDYATTTKNQMKVLIKKIDGVINQLNHNWNKKFEGLDFDNPTVVGKIKTATLDKLGENCNQLFVQFFGEKLFEESLDVAKVNMKHADSVESVAKYTAKVILDTAREEIL